MNEQSLFAAMGKATRSQAGEHLFRQGDTDTSVYFVQSGLLKAYYITPDGKELIKSFIAENEFIGSLIACHTNEPCTFNLSCLEDSYLLRIHYQDLVKAAASNPQVATFFNNGLMNLAIKKERREHEFLCKSASERYQIFKHRSPHLLDRLTQNDIARYLGITPVALSRIKTELNKVVQR